MTIYMIGANANKGNKQLHAVINMHGGGGYMLNA